MPDGGGSTPDLGAAPSDWLQIRIAGARHRQAVIDALIAQGSPGIEEAGDEIVGHVPASNAIDGIRTAILAAASDPATTIVIDPAMAFGTGEHATTRGVIRLMQEVVTAGLVVADLGAGSAILSIAAAKLGAARVVAIELDPDAESNALENIKRNGVEDRVHFVGGDAFTLLPLIAPIDLVLANILSSVLVELLPLIRDSLTGGGRAILSGILIEERQSMLQEIEREGWTLEAEHTEEGWWSALTARR